MWPNADEVFAQGDSILIPPRILLLDDTLIARFDYSAIGGLKRE